MKINTKMIKRSLLLFISLLCISFVHASLSFTIKNSSKSSITFLRSTVQLSEIPKNAFVKITSSNPYHVFVNGNCIAIQTNNVNNTFFANNFNISTFLKKGQNIIAIQSWTDSIGMDNNASFFIDTKNDKLLSLTKIENWKYLTSDCFTSKNNFSAVDARLIPSGWLYTNFTDSIWNMPKKSITTSVPNDNFVPNIKFECNTIGKIVDNTNPKFARFSDGKHFKGTLAANTTVRLLIDKGNIVNGLAALKIKGGKDAIIKLLYCEPNCKSSIMLKDSANIHSTSDTYYANGQNDQQFISFKPHCFRFVILEITTKANDVQIEQLSFVPIHYQFDELAYFKTDNVLFNKAWANWAKQQSLYTNENYISSTLTNAATLYNTALPQTLNSLLLTGDDRLMRQYITLCGKLIEQKKLNEINFFDLYFVNFIHSFYQNTADTAFIHPFMTLVIKVLDKQVSAIDTKSNLYSTEYLPNELKNKEVQQSLLLSNTLTQTAMLLDLLRFDEKAKQYHQVAIAMKRAVMQNYTMSNSFFFYDGINKQTSSQYTACLAIKAGLIRTDKINDAMQKLLVDSTLVQVSNFQRLALYNAVYQADNSIFIQKEINQQANALQNVDCLLKPDSLSFYFGQSVLENIVGIQFDKEGSKNVIIKPNLNDINKLSSRVPCQTGAIYIDLKKNRKKNKLKGTINLPANTKGVFIWNGKRYSLVEADNKIEIDLVKKQE